MYDKLLSLVLLSAIFAGASQGQRTYVACTVPSGSKKMPDIRTDFTFDETAGTVSYYWNDRGQMIRAVFSADKVTWDEAFVSGTIIRRSINRVTLEYADYIFDGHKATGNSHGTCVIVAPPADRKF